MNHIRCSCLVAVAGPESYRDRYNVVLPHLLNPSGASEVCAMALKDCGVCGGTGFVEMGTRRGVVRSRSIRVNAYHVLREVVERGTRQGIHDARKERNDPPDEYLFDCIEQAIMSEVCDYFVFDDEAEER